MKWIFSSRGGKPKGKNGEKLRSGKRDFATSIGSSLLVVSVLSLVLLTFQVPRTRAWGWDTHRLIENEAENVFSDNSYFSNHHNTLYQWCTKPDQGGGKGIGTGITWTCLMAGRIHLRVLYPGA